MKRKWIGCMLFAILVCTLPFSVSAVSLPLVVDDADILTREEEQLLADQAAQLLNAYQMDAVILTLPSLEGSSAKSCAEDFYDYNGYGIGENHSGTLFLLAMEEREWYLLSTGDAVYAMTDYALLMQEELILPYLRSGAYYDCFSVWLDSLDTYYEAYLQGEPIDGYVPEKDRYDQHDDVVYYENDPAVNWLVSTLVGLAAGGITLGILYGTMNTRRPQNSAEEYLKEGSYNLRIRRDVFLYSQVSKTRRETTSGSSGRSGSSVSRGSSGRSHGGRGGKF